MKRIPGIIPYVNDALVIRWRDPATGEDFTQGKRQPRNCLLERTEVRAYVNGGTPRAVRIIMITRRIGLREAKDLLDRAKRGDTRDRQVREIRSHVRRPTVSSEGA